MSECGGSAGGGGQAKVGARVEIDTSLPYETVKEAVCMFGGSGVWRPKPGSGPENEVMDIAKVEEQRAQLEKALVVKERETLEVLKELQTTKRCVDESRSKLQKGEADSVKIAILEADDTKTVQNEQAEKMINISESCPITGSPNPGPVSSPGLILMELKQAKVNLKRTSSDLVGVRASVETLNRKLEKEKISMQKTRERLVLNSAIISSLEEELNKTRGKLQVTKAMDGKAEGKSSEVSSERQPLRLEAEQFKKMAENAKVDVSKTMNEIEQIKLSLRTAEIRLIAAKKMEEAAKATEAAALAEIKAVTGSKNMVTLSFEEYSALTSKAQEAERLSQKRVETAMAAVDDAEMSKRTMVKKVEAASEEVKRSRKALEEAVKRVEVAKKEKLAVEGALRKWRSEHSGRRKSSVHSSTKFKNPHPSHHRKDSRVIDLNEMEVPCTENDRALKQTLSIGEILSRKLLHPEEFGEGPERNPSKATVSLAEMLSKRGVAHTPTGPPGKENNVNKPYTPRRKKFVFGKGMTHLLAKPAKK